jgi:Rrf2 family transcriptional regulator, nitric oxide-sensitive transcriptional repressor
MLSQSVEYALRAVVHLASRNPDPLTTEAIAQATLVPKAYLSKVLQQLVRGGVVRSQRGLGGGMTLVKAPESVTILEVVNAVDPLRRITTCPLGLPSHGQNLCPLHCKLDDALAEMESAFGSTTVAEMLNRPNQSVPLCDVGAVSQPPSQAR